MGKGAGGGKRHNGNQVISQDKGKVTFLPNVAPPFLYQIAHQSIDGFPHKGQLCTLSGVQPGTPAFNYVLIQSFA